jgi:hypothetical protein
MSSWLSKKLSTDRFLKEFALLYLKHALCNTHFSHPQQFPEGIQINHDCYQATANLNHKQS